MSGSETSHWLERWVRRSLLAGLIVSGLLLIAGLTVVLVRHEVRPAEPRMSAISAIRGAVTGDGLSLLDLGLLALLATPILRVAVLAVGWSLAGERRFAAVAITVLALLGLSLTLGFG